MNLKAEQKNDIVVLYIREPRVDAQNSSELKTEIAKLFAQGKRNILIDLKDVYFVDSSGLGALISGFKRASSGQGVLKLSSLQPQVRSMFELTRLHRVFEIFPSTTEALNSF